TGRAGPHPCGCRRRRRSAAPSQVLLLSGIAYLDEGELVVHAKPGGRLPCHLLDLAAPFGARDLPAEVDVLPPDVHPDAELVRPRVLGERPLDAGGHIVRCLLHDPPLALSVRLARAWLGGLSAIDVGSLFHPTRGRPGPPG